MGTKENWDLVCFNFFRNFVLEADWLSDGIEKIQVWTINTRERYGRSFFRRLSPISKNSILTRDRHRPGNSSGELNSRAYFTFPLVHAHTDTRHVENERTILLHACTVYEQRLVITCYCTGIRVLSALITRALAALPIRTILVSLLVVLQMRKPWNSMSTSFDFQQFGSTNYPAKFQIVCPSVNYLDDQTIVIIKTVSYDYFSNYLNQVFIATILCRMQFGSIQYNT